MNNFEFAVFKSINGLDDLTHDRYGTNEPQLDYHNQPRLPCHPLHLSMIGECGVSLYCKIAGVFKQYYAFYKHISFIMNLVDVICN
jgi:hypothetical protein